MSPILSRYPGVAAVVLFAACALCAPMASNAAALRYRQRVAESLSGRLERVSVHATVAVSVAREPAAVTPEAYPMTPQAPTLRLHLAEPSGVRSSFDLPAKKTLEGETAPSTSLGPPDPANPRRIPGIGRLDQGRSVLGDVLVFEILRGHAARQSNRRSRLAGDFVTIPSRQTIALVLARRGSGLSATEGGLLLFDPGESPGQDRHPGMKLKAAPTAVTASLFGRF